MLKTTHQSLAAWSAYFPVASPISLLCLLFFAFVLEAQAATCASGHAQIDAKLGQIFSKYPANSQA